MERLTKKEKQILQEIKQHVAFGATIEILNYKQDYVGIQYSKASGYYMLAGDIYVTYDGGSTGKSVKDFRFLLRPLSSLTEEIEHNGEKFVPIDKLELEGYVIGYNGFSITIGQEEGYSFGYAIDVYNQIIQKIHELHFDVFGLIDRGLALPIDGKEVENG